MQTSIPKPEKTDFATLSEIMERFYQVPFETFQTELNEWFSSRFMGFNPDLKNLTENQRREFLDKLLKSANGAFKMADDASENKYF